MTPDRRLDQQNISPDVVGQISPAQAREIFTLGQGILRAKKLNPQKPEDLQQVGAIIDDCIYRGLDVQKRNWFSASESVGPVIELGVAQRQALVEKLRAIIHNPISLSYLTSEEFRIIEGLAPLDSDLSPADQLLVQLEKRKLDLKKLQHTLFNESQLADQAQELRKTLVDLADSKLSRDDLQFYTGNILFANLLVNLALYQRLGLGVEPKDVAALAEIWVDQRTRDRVQLDIINKMKIIAAKLGLSEEGIGVYTRNIFDDINNVLTQRHITLEAVQSAGIFALKPEDILAESAEFEQVDEDIYKSIRIPEEELTAARSVLGRVREMFVELDKIADETEGLQDLNQEDPLDIYHQNVYIPYLQQLTAIDLIVVYNQGLDSDPIEVDRLKEELASTVSGRIYLEALKLLIAKEVRVAETGKEIPEFNDKGKAAAYEEVEKLVLENLLEGQLKEDQEYSEVINSLPLPVFEKYLSIVDPKLLPRQMLESIASLSIQKWVQIAVDCRVEIDYDQMTKEVSLIYNPDSQFISGFIDLLPKEKKQQLAQRLQHIIII